MMFQVIRFALDNAARAPMTGDLANAGYLALTLVLAIANAVVWAPYLGRLVAEPITEMLTEDSSTAPPNYLLRLLVYCRARGWRRCALTLALIEGIRHPEQPSAFLEGLRCATPGTWLEKVFAAEVWRFDNLQNCRRALEVLSRHRLFPTAHTNQDVNILLLGTERPISPQRPPLPLFATPALPLARRDSRIRLFAGAGQPPDSVDTPSDPAAPGESEPPASPPP